MATRSVNDKLVTKTAVVNPSTATDTAVVAAISGKVIKVHAVTIVTTLANSVSFKSATTAISAVSPLAANGGMVLPFNENGWFKTVAGEALNFTTTAATACGCTVVYSEEQ